MKVRSACISVLLSSLLREGGGEDEFPFAMSAIEVEEEEALRAWNRAKDPQQGPAAAAGPSGLRSFSELPPPPRRELKSCALEGGTEVAWCPCPGEYPCYFTRQDGTKACSSAGESSCRPGAYSGYFVDAQFCGEEQCPGGTVLSSLDKCCYSDGTLASKLGSSKVERVGNTVMIQSDEIFDLLYSGYTGGGCDKKYTGVEFATSVLHSRYKDVFDIVYVYPYYDIGKETGLSGCKSQTNLGSKPLLDRKDDGSGKLRSMVSSFPVQRGHVASMHEMGHAWLMFLKDMPSRSATINGETYEAGAHWGYTTLDKHGMLGGYAPEAFVCKNPAGRRPTKAQPCADNRLADFSPYLGSSRTSHDQIGYFAKMELLVMGLATANEIAGEELVHCKNMDATFNENTKLFEDVTCEEMIHLTAADVQVALTEDEKARQISPGTELRAAHIVVFDTKYKLPETEAELQDAKWNGYLKWIHGYGSTLETLFHENTYEKATMSFEVTDDDLGCSLNNENLCYQDNNNNKPSPQVLSKLVVTNTFLPYLFKGKSVDLIVKAYDKNGDLYVADNLKTVKPSANGGSARIVAVSAGKGVLTLRFDAGKKDAISDITASLGSGGADINVARVQVYANALTHCNRVVEDKCKCNRLKTMKKKKACVKKQATSSQCFGPKKGKKLKRALNKMLKKFKSSC